MDTVETVVSGNLGVVMMNDQLNTLTTELLGGIERGFGDLEKDPNVEVIVITRGRGSMAFSVGADVKLIAGLSDREREEVAGFMKTEHDFLLRISNSPKPVIAAVQGYCLGGGLELALACHYIIADSGAKFGFPEVGLGIIPGLGGTQRLPRKIGVEGALQLILSARSNVTTEEAMKLGLVDGLAEGDPIGAMRKFAAEVLKGDHHRSMQTFLAEETVSLNSQTAPDFSKGKPAFAVKAAITAVKNGAGKDLAEALVEVELPLFLDCLYSEDGQEGIAAFLDNKRAPRFKEVLGAPSTFAPAVSVEVQSDKSATEEKVSFAEVPPWEKDEYRMLRETIREFAEKEIAPKVSEMEEKREVSRELIQKMADMGFFGIAFPEKYGGFGLGKIGACVFGDEIGFCHPALAVVVGAHTSLGCEAVHLFGTEDQKQRYLVPGIMGEKIGALATTEPKVGSDVGGMKTSAKKVDGGWILNGRKQFITNGGVADFVVIFAQTDPLGGNTTLVAFIVDSSSAGFKFGKPEEKVGIHASSTTSIFLDDCFIPDRNLLGEVGQGFKMVMKVFNHSRITLSAGCVGFIRRALEESIKFANDRVLDGEPMLLKQLTQVALAEMEATRYLVESSVYDAAWRVDRGLDVRNEAAATKYFATELAFKVADMGVQLHGGSGFIEGPIARLWRDVRVFRLFEGTSQVQLLSIFKEMNRSGRFK